MKHLILIFSILFLAACNESESKPQVVERAPVEDLPDASIDGLWYSPSGTGSLTWCHEFAGEWVCQASAPPSVCSNFTVLNGYSIMGGGYRFTGDQAQISTYTYNFVFENNQIVMTSGPTWGFEILNSTDAVLTYGPGCSLLYKKDNR
jgi:hypothetical protein